MNDLGKTVAAPGASQRLNPATLIQMHQRLGRIETRLTDIEPRLSGLESRLLRVGGALARLNKSFRPLCR